MLGVAALGYVPDVLGTSEAGLVGTDQRQSPLLQQPEQRVMHYRRAELAGQVVAQQRQAGRDEAVQHLLIAGDRIRGRVDERGARPQRRLGVGPRRLWPAA